MKFVILLAVLLTSTAATASPACTMAGGKMGPNGCEMPKPAPEPPKKKSTKRP